MKSAGFVPAANIFLRHMYPHILTLRSDSQFKIAAKCPN